MDDNSKSLTDISSKDKHTETEIDIGIKNDYLESHIGGVIFNTSQKFLRGAEEKRQSAMQTSDTP